MIDIAIIGGGPAGLAAGLYGARSGNTTRLFESMFPGGQITKTALVENYPGLGAVDGFTLAGNMQRQAEEFGLQISYEPVEALELSGDVKRIRCGEKVYEARTVILAMGASPRKTDVPGEERFTGAGVSWCATCDGALYRDKTVAVIGGGDTALSDALYLAKFAAKVYLVHRREEFRAVKTLQDRVLEEEKILPVLSALPVEISGESAVEKLTVKNRESGEIRELAVNGVFVAIGISPNTELVHAELHLSAGHSIPVNACMQTQIPGVYAAGDIRETPLRQVVTAAADGAVAATSAVEYLMTQR